MLTKVLKCKIHRATVTKSDLDYEGSISIDTALVHAAGLRPHEAVHVWNVNTGGRLETYVIPAPEGSGEIGLNGAAARCVQPGDPVIIAAFCWLDDAEVATHCPRVVFVDGANRMTAVKPSQGEPAT